MNMRSVLAAVLLLAPVAAADSSVPQPGPSFGSVRQVFYVSSINGAGPEVPVTLESYGQVWPVKEGRYLAIDKKGVVGVLRASGKPAPGRCYDDCPKVRADARWVAAPKRAAGDWFVAVGPLDDGKDWPRARVLASGNQEPKGDAWATGLAIDLDGDGKVDLDTRWRYAPPGRSTRTQVRVRTARDWEVAEEYGFRSVFDSSSDDPLR
jgi:hypothetical protein